MKECYKPKTSYEIQKASEEYIFKTNIDDANVQDHFIAGAEWMQERMIEKAAEWLSNNMFHSINNGVQINGTCVSDFVEKFKQTMEDESRRLD